MDWKKIAGFALVLVLGAFIGSMYPQINIIKRVTG